MLLAKLKDSLISVLPIAAIVVILSLTVAPIGTSLLVSFVIGCVFAIIGMTLFSVGADVAMMPIGEMVGVGITKTRKLPFIIAISLVIGIIITIAEPDLSVLATSLEAAINKWLLIILVAVGVGVFLTVSMLRVIFGISFRLLLVASYIIVFGLALALSLVGKTAFLPLSFDSGGVTTGPMTVPFIIALGVGVSAISGKAETSDSFGYVALASVGPIIAVLVLGFFCDTTTVVTATQTGGGIAATYERVIVQQLKDTAIAIGPIALFFLAFRLTANRNMPKAVFFRIIFGIVYTYVGLVLFMTGAYAGFSGAGSAIGAAIAQKSKYSLVPLGVVLGFVIVAAEPAVHVLNTQIEKLSEGTIKKSHVLFMLMCGVGLSVGLAMLRIIFTFSIWWLILSGYAVALVLAFIVPKTYTAIAFDSGGVASGPMTAAFLLPLATGACTELNGGSAVMEYAYGVVAMVAMTPLIAVQLLGLITMLKAKAQKRVALSLTPAQQPLPGNVEIVETEDGATCPASDEHPSTETAPAETEGTPAPEVPAEIEIIDLD